MSDDIKLDLIGDDELMAALHALDQKTQHKFLKRVVSDASNIYVKAAKKQVPVRTTKLHPPSVTVGKKRSPWHPPGTGKKNIIKKAGRSRRNATYFVGPRTGTGDRRRDAWYLKFPEYGTKKLAGRFWFRIAYATNKEKVEANMTKSVRKIITREWNRKVKK